MEKHKILLAAALAGFLFAATVQTASDNDEKDNQIVTIKGKVETTEKDGKLERVKVVTDSGKHYWVVLDDKGEKLGHTMDSKYVEVKGYVHVKDDIKWLTVEHYKKTGKD